MATKTKEFDKVLLDSIDEALLSLGESVRKSLYFHIEHNFKLPKNGIPENIGQFQLALEKILGVGSRFIEILIMKNLHGRLREPIIMDNNEELDFVKYVDAARNGYGKEPVTNNTIELLNNFCVMCILGS